MAIHVSFRLAISHEAIIITNRSSEPCGLVLQSMILYSHEIIANSLEHSTEIMILLVGETWTTMWPCM